MAPHPPGAAVTTGELEAAVVLAGVHEGGLAQGCVDIRRAQLGVLGAEGVERGRDDPQPPSRDPVRGVRAAREDERARFLDVRPQEGPSRVGERGLGVAADVTAPHDVCAAVGQHAREPGGLGVVQQDDVARAHHGPQHGGVALEDLDVVLLLVDAQRAAVTRHPVQHVVEALGDGEELGVSAEHEPAGRDPGATAVGEQGLEHLGHPAAAGGGVDVPDGAPGQQRPCAVCVAGQALGPDRAEEARQPVQRDRVDLDLPHASHAPTRRCAPSAVPGAASLAAMTTPLVARMREFGTTIFAEMSALAAEHRRDQPGPGLPRHRRAAGDARGGPGGDRGGRNQYPPGPGVPELLDAIAAHQARFYGLTARPALARCWSRSAPPRRSPPTVLALCEPGDEVVTFEPYYDSYAATDRPGGGRAAHVGAAVPRLRRRRGVAAGGVLAADPDGAAQHPAQPDRQGLHPGRARADLRAGARARRLGGDRRGLRAPRLRRRCSTCRSRRCRGWPSAP